MVICFSFSHLSLQTMRYQMTMLSRQSLVVAMLGSLSLVVSTSVQFQISFVFEYKTGFPRDNMVLDLEAKII